MLDSGAHRRWAVELVRRVARAPCALRRVDRDRCVHNDRRRRIPAIKCRCVDERFERRPRLTLRLGGTVKDRMLIAKATLHRDHAARVDVHRHKAALHLGNLAQRPAHEITVIIYQAAHMHHITNREVVKEIADQPTNVFARNNEWFGRVFDDIFDTNCQGIFGDIQDHRWIPCPVKFYVARQVQTRQSSTPQFFVSQCLYRDHFAGAAPDARLAVIQFQRLLQRLRCGDLQFRINSRADRKTARKELFFAKVLA